MKLAILLIALFATSALPLVANAEYKRSKAVLRAFVYQQACPATGMHRLPCPGWQIDHIIPLKCGGPDDLENLQWLTVQAHKEKTKREAMLCQKK